MDTILYKQALEAERTELEKQLTSLGTLDHTIVGDWVSNAEEPLTVEADENVVADQAEELISRTGELDVLETRFRDVVRALDKIAAGTFGTCEICQAVIESDRLTVNPAARTCKAHLNDEVDLAL